MKMYFILFVLSIIHNHAEAGTYEANEANSNFAKVSSPIIRKLVKMKDIANPIFDENLRNQRNQPIFDKNILKTTMLNVIKKQIKEQAFINQRIRLQRKIQCLQMFADYRLCFNVYYD